MGGQVSTTTVNRNGVSELVSKVATDQYQTCTLNTVNVNLVNVSDTSGDVSASNINMKVVSNMDQDCVQKEEFASNLTQQITENLKSDSQTESSGIKLAELQIAETATFDNTSQKFAQNIQREVIQKCYTNSDITNAVKISRTDGNVDLSNINMAIDSDAFTKCIQEGTSKSDAIQQLEKDLSASSETKQTGFSFDIMSGMGIFAACVVLAIIVVVLKRKASASTPVVMVR